MKEKIYDCLIIGGGVVGCAILNKLTRLGKKAALLDKASDVATGASKANSGIVHAGYDPLPNTLKAKINVRGSKLFPSLCKRLNVPFKKCGALVLGDDKEMVERLYERGKQNGVRVEILNQQQILEKEPNVNKAVTVGLFAPTSAIVSPYLLTIALADEAIINGGEVFLEEDLVSCQKNGEIFEILTKKRAFFAKNIINCAGSGYNDVAKILKTERKKLEFRRGEYFVFDKSYDLKAKHTLFPLPTKIGKGVLVTPTVDGNFLVGPTSEENNGTKETTYQGLNSIKQKSALLFDGINFRHAIREFAGVRVICGDDFVIEKSKKVSGVINIAGICSPGLTSSPAIAEMVASLLGYKDEEKKNLKTLPKYTLFKNMDKKSQIALAKSDENYRQIVCKCENITKGDILMALSRPLKVRSVDGVKRRTNAGMGRCQGGFCFTKVVTAIMDSRKIEYEDVLKENRGSNVAIGDIRGEK